MIEGNEIETAADLHGIMYNVLYNRTSDDIVRTLLIYSINEYCHYHYYYYYYYYHHHYHYYDYDDDEGDHN